jgi:hypothetical protein
MAEGEAKFLVVRTVRDVMGVDLNTDGEGR